MKRLGNLVRFGLLAVIVAAVIEQLRRPPEERSWNGQILFVPYDLRPPTLQRVRERFWNPDDPRILTPHVWGAGWSINLYQLKRLLQGAGA